MPFCGRRRAVIGNGVGGGTRRPHPPRERHPPRRRPRRRRQRRLRRLRRGGHRRPATAGCCSCAHPRGRSRCAVGPGGVAAQIVAGGRGGLGRARPPPGRRMPCHCRRSPRRGRRHRHSTSARRRRHAPSGRRQRAARFTGAATHVIFGVWCGTLGPRLPTRLRPPCRRRHSHHPHCPHSRAAAAGRRRREHPRGRRRAAGPKCDTASFGARVGRGTRRPRPPTGRCPPSRGSSSRPPRRLLCRRRNCHRHAAAAGPRRRVQLRRRRPPARPAIAALHVVIRGGRRCPQPSPPHPSAPALSPPPPVAAGAGLRVDAAARTTPGVQLRTSVQAWGAEPAASATPPGRTRRAASVAIAATVAATANAESHPPSAAAPPFCTLPSAPWSDRALPPVLAARSNGSPSRREGGRPSSTERRRKAGAPAGAHPQNSASAQQLPRRSRLLAAAAATAAAAAAGDVEPSWLPSALRGEGMKMSMLASTKKEGRWGGGGGVVAAVQIKIGNGTPSWENCTSSAKSIRLFATRLLHRHGQPLLGGRRAP